MLIDLKGRPCLGRSGFAQAGRSLSDRLAHARMDKSLWTIWSKMVVIKMLDDEGRFSGQLLFIKIEGHKLFGG